MSKKQTSKATAQTSMPSVEEIQKELETVESMDDFFGKEGVFARLFARTLEQMLEAELTAHLGYEHYESKGRNSGNSRNGHYSKTVRTSEGASRSGSVSPSRPTSCTRAKRSPTATSFREAWRSTGSSVPRS